MLYRLAGAFGSERKHATYRPSRGNLIFQILEMNVPRQSHPNRQARQHKPLQFDVQFAQDTRQGNTPTSPPIRGNLTCSCWRWMCHSAHAARQSNTPPSPPHRGNLTYSFLKMNMPQQSHTRAHTQAPPPTHPHSSIHTNTHTAHTRTHERTQTHTNTYTPSATQILN